jgi:RNA polymerase sigma factor (sigma-70 family)
VLASLVGFLGDFDLAEEAAQEAFAVAAERWPRDGVPANPGAWLTITARNRAIDRIRRERTLAEKTRQLEVPQVTMDELDDTVIEDERLELIFTCCHPSLALEGQVALTLRALGGLTTEEIARAFLVSEETMKKRLSRAKVKIKATGIPFAVPAEHLLLDRLNAVLAVVYLIYNEGYSGRIDLAGEAIRLGRVLAVLMPDEPEVHGLLALMQIHHARRKARFAGEELVLLEDQDRSLWDAEKIAAGRTALERALALRGRGPTNTNKGKALTMLGHPIEPGIDNASVYLVSRIFQPREHMPNHCDIVCECHIRHVLHQYRTRLHPLDDVQEGPPQLSAMILGITCAKLYETANLRTPRSRVRLAGRPASNECDIDPIEQLHDVVPHVLVDEIELESHALHVVSVRLQSPPIDVCGQSHPVSSTLKAVAQAASPTEEVDRDGRLRPLHPSPEASVARSIGVHGQSERCRTADRHAVALGCGH